MPRDPRAATTLIRELRTIVPDLNAEADDLDGLGVYRTFRLTSKDFKGLEDVITAVADLRIVSSRSITGGVEVTFSHFPRVADSTDSFGASGAETLITRKRKPAKKTARKKVTPKNAG
jgi:hypothetical protein